MSLQMRPQGSESVPYAPARDIVYLAPAIIKNAVQRLEEGKFKALEEWLDDKDIDGEDLANVFKAFHAFLSTAHEATSRNVHMALEEAGWFDLRDEARVAFIFYVGAQLLGVMWQGVRDSSAITDEALLDIQRLAGLGDRIQQALSRPKWQRRPLRLLDRVRRWLVKLLGANVN